MKFSLSTKSGYLALGCLVGFVTATAFSPVLSVFAGHRPVSHPDLAEMQALVRTCRTVIPVNGSVEVFDNTEMGDKPENRIGTINVGTPMRLTGVIRESEDFSAVQVYMPNRRFAMYQPVGWVDASQITEC
jgi:hypothetical protein